MSNILEGAREFIYPLGLFSFLAVYIIVERLISLRTSRVMPRELLDSLLTGDALKEQGDLNSVMGRILRFYHKSKPDADSLKAYAMLEITRMERGLFILDIVTAGAPLVGLLGTVTGLVQVFGHFNDGMTPEKAGFISGIALALYTTMMGLFIAIPSLAGLAYLNRRIENLSAQINVAVERLIHIAGMRQANDTSEHQQ